MIEGNAALYIAIASINRIQIKGVSCVSYESKNQQGNEFENFIKHDASHVVQ